MDVSARGRGVYAFGKFRLDPDRRVLTHDGAVVPLRPMVFDVLLYLVEHPNKVVGKDELLDAVWADRVVEESNLSQAIFWLRAALREQVGDEAGVLIGTARGQGYRFTADVRWEVSGGFEPEAAAPGGEALGPPPPPKRRSWPRLAVVGVLALLACAAALVLAPWRGHRRAGPLNTVVLADFQNRTGEVVFDRTLGNVLRIDLGQSPYLNVMSERQARDGLALMKRPTDAPLTAPVAQEICVRANGDAVLAGALDAVGSRYLVTLSATDCSGGRVLAAEKAQVGGREAVVPALDRLIGGIRRKLGEPVASVDRFNVPLEPARTASLDALKAYSEGVWLNEHGRRNEAIPDFKRAIELDPDFAAPYSSLAVIYGGTNADSLAADAIARAYQLRDGLDERQKLAVTTLYNQIHERDFNETARTLAVWTTVYPTDAKAWSNLANMSNVLGRYGEGVEAGKRAVALNPTFEAAYVVLARAYLRSGRPDQARAVGALAAGRGLAGDATHGVLLAADLMRGDSAAVQKEMAWARGKPAERILLSIEGQIAYGEGRVRDGDALFDRSAALSEQQGLPDFARAYRARLLNDLGLPDRARALLATVKDEDDDDFIFTLAEIGDEGRARTLLARQTQRFPRGTLITYDFAPEIRAALALRRGKPAQAVDALRIAIPYQSRTFDIPYVLGRSYLSAGDGPRAGAAFQLILDHQGWYPESPLFPLARLGLARALALGHDAPAARHAYEAFFAAWRGADSDLPLLRDARAEYARLR